jgi:hypothetical protein
MGSVEIYFQPVPHIIQIPLQNQLQTVVGSNGGQDSIRALSAANAQPRK